MQTVKLRFATFATQNRQTEKTKLYNDCILGSDRKYFAAMGLESLAPLSKLNHKFTDL